MMEMARMKGWRKRLLARGGFGSGSCSVEWFEDASLLSP
jgi:hypothetical protein